MEVDPLKKCMRMGCQAHFAVKMLKIPQRWSALGSCAAQKVHAAEAPSTCRSQNFKSTSASEHFWTFSSSTCNFEQLRC